MKNKHFSFDDRLEIERYLKENLSFKQISKTLVRIVPLFPKKLKII